MDIAKLNVFITFQKSEAVIDKIGNHTLQWVPYYETHATVSGENGKESDIAGMTVDSADIIFTIRYCKKANALTSTAYRVLFNDEIYNILSVDHMNYRKKSIKIHAKKARR